MGIEKERTASAFSFSYIGLQQPQLNAGAQRHV